MTVQEGKLSELVQDTKNANKGTVDGAKLLKKSLQDLGAGRSILVDKNGQIIAGNKTAATALSIGIDKIKVIETDGSELVVVKRLDVDIDSKKGRELALADNKVSEINLEFDQDVIDQLAQEFDINLEEWGFDVELEAGSGTQRNEGGLAKRFVVPPFSVLDTRQGYWKERKELWRDRIGDFGESRNATLRQSKSGDDPGYYRKKTAIEEKLGRKLTNAEFEQDHYVRSTKLPVGVSLLDPVLAEVIVQWFGIQGGAAFDTFAGDSVFGFVSAATGMSFTGIELRQEQADLNQARIDSEKLPGKYICDDGRHVAKHIPVNSQDLLFSCPPYFDLEVYSDDPNDASNQKTYGEFYCILDEALGTAVECLKENRFAVIVCGDVRDKKTGAYYGFPQDIIKTMVGAGMYFYNECILIEQAGNAAIRANGQMKHRKVVKTHQQVLVFYKGDPRQIKTHFPEIVYEPEDLESFAMDTDNGPGEIEE